MLNIQPINSKVAPNILRTSKNINNLIKKGLDLPKEKTLAPLIIKSKAKANQNTAISENKSKFFDCGNVEAFCTPLLTF